jgi:Tol biopolymer transport system component
MAADGSNQRRLTNNTVSDNGPAWSPGDARIVFVSERAGNAEI